MSRQEDLPHSAGDAFIVEDRKIRHPLRNFFIKKSIQFKMILQIFLTVLVAAFLTVGVLVLVYSSKSEHGSFYYMSNNIMQDLELKSILGTILPPILIVELIGVGVAFGIGMFSSRKIAVPLYKIEKWAHRLRNGKLKSQLAFREIDHLDELTNHCNGVTDYFRKALLDIQDHTNVIEQNPENVFIIQERTAALKKVLERFEL